MHPLALVLLLLVQGKPVTTVLPERRDLSRSVSRPALATAYAGTTLVARVEGYVEAVRVEEGDVVSEGAVVAALAVPDLEAGLSHARAEVAEVEAALALAEAEALERRAEADLARTNRDWLEKEARRIAGLRAEGASTEQEAEAALARFEAARAQAASAEARLRSSEARISVARSRIESAKAEARRAEVSVGFAQVRAPYPKTLVTRRFVHPGTHAEAGRTPLLAVADVERIRVRGDVTERDAVFVRAGTPVRIGGAALASPLEAAVTRTAGVLDPGTLNLRFEVEVANGERRLFPGSSLDVRLELERRPGALFLPASALLTIGGKPHVFVVSDGRARLRPVRIGFDDGASVEVVEGIGPDDPVVVGGKERVADGDAVIATPEKGRP